MQPLPIPYWLALALVAIAGTQVPLGLAPYNYWPLTMLGLGLMAWATHGRSPKQTALMALFFGFGLYGVGASWVYISIHQFGSTSTLLSLFLTAGFVAGLSCAFAIPFYLYGRWFNQSNLGVLVGFPAIWVLGEWMRSWFLTGFPWLYVGYGHLDTPLAGWAPILGVFGVSLAVAASSAWLAVWVSQRCRLSDLGVITRTGLIIATLWISGGLLQGVEWTRYDETPVTLGMAQGNIPQEKKWDPDFLQETFKIFNGLSEDLWQYDWVIWPEAAIPLLYHQALGPLKHLDSQANRTHSVFISGILYDQPEGYKFYNSIVARGLGDGITYKMRLVPFGEYVPLERWLRGLIEFFNLPTSYIHPGPGYTNGLQTPAGEIAPSICYEVVYPDLVAKRALTAQFLLTISNDAWFGHSIGPIQHFQMAQMRALETGRYMIRSTNNGISGIIDPKGRTLVQGGRFTRETIVGEVYAARGQTPFMLMGSWPVVLLSMISLMVLRRKLQARTKPPATTVTTASQT